MSDTDRINMVMDAIDTAKSDAVELLQKGRLFDFKQRCEDIDALEKCLEIEIDRMLGKLAS